MRNPIVAMVSAAWFIALSLAANAATLYVECESFAELGGWVVDPHSMKALCSSYVMAHGIGKPVADAKTTGRGHTPGTRILQGFPRFQPPECPWNRVETPLSGCFREGAETGATSRQVAAQEILSCILVPNAEI